LNQTDGAFSFATHPRIAAVSALGILPLNEEFSLFVRAGGAHWWYDANFAVAGVGGVTLSESSTDLLWGAGATMYVDHALLRLEYKQSQTSLNVNGATLDGRWTLISLSVVWML
jgi:hypothetical protein